MSRITDTERGARIAQKAAERVLNAGKGPQLPLFKPTRIPAAKRALWRGIAAAAAECIAEEAALRGVSRRKAGR